MRTKAGFICLCIIMVILMMPASCYAETESYNGFTYNHWASAVPAPNGYDPEKTITGIDLGVGAFVNPQDIFVDKKNDVYILDSGNNRIVITDANFKLIKVLDSFFSDDGKETLNNPEGIFVDGNGSIYIADTDNKRVLCVNQEGRILKNITKPESKLFDKDLDFIPTKVLADSKGSIYVLVKNLYKGAAHFDSGAGFDGFFGSNQIQASPLIILNNMWKRFQTKDQRRATGQDVPVEYTNFTIDKDDFIYTTTLTNLKSDVDNKKRIKKLNMLGKNLFEQTVAKVYGFGDATSNFVDVAVNDKGYFYAIDNKNNRICAYDDQGRFLFAFGGNGEQAGTFLLPTAIDTLNDRIIVLDMQKRNITVFKLTEFGSCVLKAVTLYNDGKYSQAEQPWKEILKRDSNYELAYSGIGEIAMMNQDYVKAMKYFKLGFNKQGYNEAYKAYKMETAREYMPYILNIAILILLIVSVLKILKRNKTRKLQKKYRRVGE